MPNPKWRSFIVAISKTERRRGGELDPKQFEFSHGSFSSRQRWTHVRDDAGHSSSAITDKYIDIELRERHRSARKKLISEEN